MMHNGEIKFMTTSSNGNISVLLSLCEENPPVTGGLPSQRPVTRSFDIFFYMCLNKRLRKQSRRRLFETSSCSLWHHCYFITVYLDLVLDIFLEMHLFYDREFMYNGVIQGQSDYPLKLVLVLGLCAGKNCFYFTRNVNLLSFRPAIS